MTGPTARPTVGAASAARLTGAVLVLVVLGWLVPRTAAAAGGWGWPVDGPPRVVRGFDPPSVRWGPGHRGVDLSAQVGAEVRAAGAGRVTFAGPLAGRGVVVVAHRDGTRTTYEPVVPSVAVGDPVATGDVLGRLAATPGHCLPAACVHWGLLRGRVYLDPLALVRVPRARLLPIWVRGPGGGTVPAGPGRDGSGRSATPVRTDVAGTGTSERPWRLVAADQSAPALVGLAGLALLAVGARSGRRR